MLGVRFPVPNIEGELHQRAEALLAGAERLLGTPAPRTELGEQQAQSNEYEEGQRVLRRCIERIHRGDEPIRASRYADKRSEQAGSASAVPGAQDHRRDRKLVNGGAFLEGKYAA